MNYQPILQHYQNCLDQHGDTPLGADWPNAQDIAKRYTVMAEIIREPEFSLLDYGCGTGDFYAYLQKCMGMSDYVGVDVNPRAIAYAIQKYPNARFAIGSGLSCEAIDELQFDYIILNGVFTEKCSLSFDEMWEYCQVLLEKLFAQTKKGLAFNVMSSCVDWEREDLFHLPLSTLELFLTQKLSKKYVMRRDYGLYEYTCYVYK